MKRLVAVALILLAAPAAFAEPLSFIRGGVGIAMRTPDRDPPPDFVGFGYEDGTSLFLTVGSHYASGVMLRVDYAYTYYDAMTALGGAAVIEEDIQTQDARGGVFLATRRERPVGGRVGLGYAYGHERASPGPRERIQDGGFLEAAASVRVAQHLDLELAAVAMKLDGRRDYDAEVGELRFEASVPAGPAFVLFTTRYAVFDRESPFDEDVLEFRLGLAGEWE